MYTIILQMSDHIFCNLTLNTFSFFFKILKYNLSIYFSVTALESTALASGSYLNLVGDCRVGNSDQVSLVDKL